MSTLISLAFDGYWGEPAKTKNIRVRIITDPQARYAALDSEEVMGCWTSGYACALGDELLKDDRFAMAVQTSNITHIMLLKGEGTKFFRHAFASGGKSGH